MLYLKHGTENRTLWKVDQKYLESFEMWCWRRMEQISWTKCVRNGEVLQRFKGETNILQTIKRKKANWIGMNCLLKHVIEGKIEGRIEVTGRQSRTHKQLLNDLKEERGYWKLNEEARNHIHRTRFGRGYGPVI
jgi:hypothetical protein